MATTTFIFDPKDQKEKKKKQKPIEFISKVAGNTVLSMSIDMDKDLLPHDWDNIVLLSNNEEYDLMYAYDDNLETEGIVYIGHWNDGIVFR